MAVKEMFLFAIPRPIPLVAVSHARVRTSSNISEICLAKSATQKHVFSCSDLRADPDVQYAWLPLRRSKRRRARSLRKSKKPRHRKTLQHSLRDRDGHSTAAAFKDSFTSYKPYKDHVKRKFRNGHFYKAPSFIGDFSCTLMGVYNLIIYTHQRRELYPPRRSSRSKFAVWQ